MKMNKPNVARSKLSKVTIRGAVWHQGDEVLDVTDLHSFLQAVGYLKFTNEGPVVFRGQGAAYSTMIPAMFRDLKKDQKKVVVRAPTNDKAVRRRVNEMNAFLATNRPHLGEVPDQVVEAVLQHYGLRTCWLDLVDNAWIALWFGCHELKVRAGTPFDGWHFVVREQTSNSSVYVYAIHGGKEAESAVDGVWKTTGGLVAVDLRRAAPSQFLRPHAQHAWLMKRQTYDSPNDMDLGDFVVGIIRIPLSLAMTWIGGGHLMTVHSLFPPTYYDDGYSRLLRLPYANPTCLGKLAIVEP